MYVIFVQIRSVRLGRLTHVQSCWKGSRQLTGWIPNVEKPTRQTPINQDLSRCLSPRINACARYCDLSSQKYSLIYSLPHIRILRVVSRLKLLQTGITITILPPVFYLYLQGDVSSYKVCYATGIAVFAAVMLYTISNILRKVVGMMYLDSSQTTLKVSHLTFWGKRQDIYLPVSDIMTIGDTGSSGNERILKLRRYSSPHTLYFSPYYGRVQDQDGFEKVFGKF